MQLQSTAYKVKEQPGFFNQVVLFGPKASKNSRTARALFPTISNPAYHAHLKRNLHQIFSAQSWFRLFTANILTGLGCLQLHLRSQACTENGIGSHLYDSPSSTIFDDGTTNEFAFLRTAPSLLLFSGNSTEPPLRLESGTSITPSLVPTSSSLGMVVNLFLTSKIVAMR